MIFKCYGIAISLVQGPYKMYAIVNRESNPCIVKTGSLDPFLWF